MLVQIAFKLCLPGTNGTLRLLAMHHLSSSNNSNKIPLRIQGSWQSRHHLLHHQFNRHPRNHQGVGEPERAYLCEQETFTLVLHANQVPATTRHIKKIHKWVGLRNQLHRNPRLWVLITQFRHTRVPWRITRSNRQCTTTTTMPKQTRTW